MSDVMDCARTLCRCSTRACVRHVGGLDLYLLCSLKQCTFRARAQARTHAGGIASKSLLVVTSHRLGLSAPPYLFHRVATRDKLHPSRARASPALQLLLWRLRNRDSAPTTQRTFLAKTRLAQGGPCESAVSSESARDPL